MRSRRELTTATPASEPIRPEQILLSANVLLTTPLETGQLSELEAFLDVLPREFAYAVEFRHRAFFDDEGLAGHADGPLALL